MANPMLCLNNGQQQNRRYTRAPIVFSRPQGNSQANSQSNKTKYAIAFLCLFDGLRTPSIRRLVRKPRTICQKPLLSFDPSFYAPSSTNALQELYLNTISCPCEITVDPSVQAVMGLVQRFGAAMPPQRIVLHYFGHGCIAPTDAGALFFFSEDRTKYKPLKIGNLLNSCTCPLCFIFDCPCAAVLSSHLSTKNDIIGFFACEANESLPLSTDAPMDLFSSCLLNPFETAIWWHRHRHSALTLDEIGKDLDEINTLKQFFESLLEAIFYDSQESEVFKAYTKDPSMAALARGYALAERVMLSFNVHPSVLPALKSMDNHCLWSFWDIAIDCGLTMSKDDAAQMIFHLFTSSFTKYASNCIFPIFAFFLKTPDFHQKSAETLLDYIDSTPGIAEMAARSIIPKTIVELERPSPKSLIILSKLIATEQSSPFDQQTPIAFATSKDIEVLKAGMLSLCCAIATSTLASFNRLTQICIEYSSECAPYSSLLLGLLIERAGRLMNLPLFGSKFVPLLKSERCDVRATTAYLLGSAKDTSLIDPLAQLLDDKSSLVRAQAMISLSQLLKTKPNQSVLHKIEDLKNDQNPVVQATYNEIKNDISSISASNDPSVNQTRIPNNPLLTFLIQSIKETNFLKRYETCVFSSE